MQKILVALVLIGVALFYWLRWDSQIEQSPLLEQIDPASPALIQMVAALDDPLDSYKNNLPKNIIWCSAALVACDELQAALPGDIELSVLQDLIARAGHGRDTLPTDDYLSFGGPNNEEFLAQQGARFAERFPDHSFPSFAGAAWIGYCYLKTRVQFSTAFRQNPADLVFEDSQGTATPVRSFGYSKEDTYASRYMQVHFLYRDRENSRRNIVDLDHSSSTEILVIGSPLGATLAEAWTEAKQRMESTQGGMSTGVLAVPRIAFSHSYDFPELSRDEPLLKVKQDVWFALDESGVRLTAKATVIWKGESSQETLFDRPFLLVMRVRGNEEPFFMLWVRNADILIER